MAYWKHGASAASGGKAAGFIAAKTQFSRLVDRAAAGEEIIIARAGKPVARLAPLTTAPVPRKPGLLKGHIRISDDFNAPLPMELLEEFYSGPIEPLARKRRRRK